MSQWKREDISGLIKRVSELMNKEIEEFFCGSLEFEVGGVWLTWEGKNFSDGKIYPFDMIQQIRRKFEDSDLVSKDMEVAQDVRGGPELRQVETSPGIGDQGTRE